MCILLEDLFQNLKEKMTFVVGLGHEAAQRSYSSSYELNSLMFKGGNMSSTAFILSRFASIPRLLTIKPKNFPAETPKAHLAGFNFIL